MAVTSVTTAMAGAINYTVVTDSSADWASVSNSTYFYDKTDKLVHYKDSTGTVQEIFSGSGITVGTTPVTSGTDGRVFFQAGGVVQQDGAFNWDNTNKRLGIGANATSPSSALFIRTNTLVANDIFTLQNGQYGNEILRVRDNVTASQSTVGSIFIGARLYSTAGSNTNQFDIGGFGLGGSYGDYLSNSVWLNNAGNVGDGLGTSVISVSSNFYVNLQTTKKYKFEAVTGNFGIGNVGSLGARLDVRAQGALSTDIAFRVRNSADTRNAFEILGDEITKVRADGNVSSALPLQIESSTGGFSTWLGLSIAQTVRSGYFALQSQGLQDNYNHVRFISGRSAGASQISAYITQTTTDRQGHWQFRTQVHLGDAVRLYNNAYGLQTFVVETGTAPSATPTDGFVQYSADITAGNAAPHFRTENGAIVKVYQETTAVASATLVSNAGTAITDTDTFDGYTLKQIVKALRNQGLLA